MKNGIEKSKGLEIGGASPYKQFLSTESPPGPQMASTPKLEPKSYWWEASALTTVPSLAALH